MFFKTVFNYFLNVYQSNTKYRNSKFFNLKLFFERDTKSNKSFLNLGNVFKNSKWSSLKNTLIKYNLIQEFFCFIGVILTFIFLGDKAYEEFVILTDSIIDLAHDFIFLTYALLSYSFLCFLIKFFDFSLINLSKPKATKIKEIKKRKIIKFTKRRYEDASPLLFKNFYHSGSKLNKVLGPDNGTGFKIKQSLFREVVPNNKYTLDNLSSININSSLSLKDLESLANNKSLLLLNNNSTNSLDVLRGDRWLAKNSLLDDSILINSNKYSQTKKLINNSPNFSNENNVWVSTNLFKSNLDLTSNLVFKKDNLNLSFINLNLSTSVNFNLFEDSRLFIFKKYFFTSNMQTNNLVFDSNFYKNNVEIKTNSINYHNLLLNLSNISLDYNLINLYISEYSLKPEHIYLGSSNLSNYVLAAQKTQLTLNNLILLEAIYAKNQTTYFYFK